MTQPSKEAIVNSQFRNDKAKPHLLDKINKTGHTQSSKANDLLSRIKTALDCHDHQLSTTRKFQEKTQAGLQQHIFTKILILAHNLNVYLNSQDT